MNSVSRSLLAIQFLFTLWLTGCGGIKDIFARWDEKDFIEEQLASSKVWSVYQVWITENLSGSILTGRKDRAEHTRIMLSPLYSTNDAKGLQNETTLERWLSGLIEDNEDITYLAIQKVDSMLTYDEAYRLYRNMFDYMVRLSDSGTGLNEDTMNAPSKTYRNEFSHYPYEHPYFLVVPQSRRGLEISHGTARIQQ